MGLKVVELHFFLIFVKESKPVSKNLKNQRPPIWTKFGTCVVGVHQAMYTKAFLAPPYNKGMVGSRRAKKGVELHENQPNFALSGLAIPLL